MLISSVLSKIRLIVESQELLDTVITMHMHQNPKKKDESEFVFRKRGSQETVPYDGFLGLGLVRRSKSEGVYSSWRQTYRRPF